MSPRVIFFEDTPQRFEELSRLLKGRLTRLNARALLFDKESDIGKFVLEPEPGTLVVLDWDLTKYPHPVLRELVRGLCNENGIPVLIYHYTHDSSRDRAYAARWKDQEISIDLRHLTNRKVADAVIAYLRGFLLLRKDLLTAPRSRSVVDAVLRTLSVPDESQVQLSQYLWGSPIYLQLAGLATRPDRVRHAATSVGYWLRNELMEYPGVLLNPIAAASFLDIRTEDLRRPAVESLFKPAVYRGPFNETGPYWWSSSLEQIVGKAGGGVESGQGNGLAMAKARGLSVRQARCIEGHLGAGYYCIFTHQPVCLPHSVRPDGWLPLGANRSRIHRRVYERLLPWVPRRME
jgi:hypothetical protein